MPKVRRVAHRLAPDIDLAILFVSTVPRILTRHLSGRYVETVEHVGGADREDQCGQAPLVKMTRCLIPDFVRDRILSDRSAVSQIP